MLVIMRQDVLVLSGQTVRQPYIYTSTGNPTSVHLQATLTFALSDIFVVCLSGGRKISDTFCTSSEPCNIQHSTCDTFNMHATLRSALSDMLHLEIHIHCPDVIAPSAVFQHKHQQPACTSQTGRRQQNGSKKSKEKDASTTQTRERKWAESGETHLSSFPSEEQLALRCTARQHIFFTSTYFMDDSFRTTHS